MKVEDPVDLDSVDPAGPRHRNLPLSGTKWAGVQNDAVCPADVGRWPTLGRCAWRFAIVTLGAGRPVADDAMGLRRFLRLPACISRTTLKALAGRQICRDERAIFPGPPASAYSLPTAYKSCGGALKERGTDRKEKTQKRSFYEDRLEALRKSAPDERRVPKWPNSREAPRSVTSENVYG